MAWDQIAASPRCNINEGVLLDRSRDELWIDITLDTLDANIDSAQNRRACVNAQEIVTKSGSICQGRVREVRITASLCQSCPHLLSNPLKGSRDQGGAARNQRDGRILTTEYRLC
jgi:hypothetical protein